MTSRNAQFDLAAHDFLVLLDRPLKRFIERPKLLDFPGKTFDLPTVSHGKTSAGSDVYSLIPTARPSKRL